ncbi:MAG: hypothetical protein ACI9CA_000006 [Natronomonas sp.]|jgi:hypothetical protein
MQTTDTPDHEIDTTREQFEQMSYRARVGGIPTATGAVALTKTQAATLVLIATSGARAYGQVRDYGGYNLSDGTYIPTESVPQALAEKGVARIKRRKQVQRRTGRGASGFESKPEGGHVRATSEAVEALADALGFDSRHDDDLERFARQTMQDHPNAR